MLKVLFEKKIVSGSTLIFNIVLEISSSLNSWKVKIFHNSDDFLVYWYVLESDTDAEAVDNGERSIPRVLLNLSQS